MKIELAVSLCRNVRLVQNGTWFQAEIRSKRGWLKYYQTQKRDVAERDLTFLAENIQLTANIDRILFS